MHKVIALYPPPKDPAHFKKYYEGTHLPLAQQMPGLISSRHSFAIEGVGAPSPYFCVWEGTFADEAAMGAAMQSPIGQKVAADVANYATGGVTLLHFDEQLPPESTNGSKADTFNTGLQIRRDMFGPANSDKVIDSATDFNRTAAGNGNALLLRRSLDAPATRSQDAEHADDGAARRAEQAKSTEGARSRRGEERRDERTKFAKCFCIAWSMRECLRAWTASITRSKC